MEHHALPDYYDLSTPSWTNGTGLTKVDNTTYTGEYYFFQGTWNDGTTDYVVTANPAFSGTFVDNTTASLNVTALSATELTLTRSPVLTGTSGMSVLGTFKRGSHEVAWTSGQIWNLTVVNLPNQDDMLEGTHWTSEWTTTNPSGFSMRRFHALT